jgi:uncharacterized protein (DUF2235 family)
VFLFDGTNSDATRPDGAEPTNVFRLNSLIAESVRQDRKVVPQITFYLPGIGTKFTAEGMFGRIKEWILGQSVDSQVMRAYVNLVSNYRSGDQIVLVGFSRGAIAARLFARLIIDFGIIRSQSIKLCESQLEEFFFSANRPYREYMDRVSQRRTELQESIHADGKVKFLGLFDCVYGLGDEFKGFLKEVDDRVSEGIEKYVHLMSLHDARQEFILSRLIARAEVGREIWVPGVHSDIGGGYSSNFIANVCLLTMAEEMRVKARIGLDATVVQRIKEQLQASARIEVNSEPFIAHRSDRSEQLSEGDLLHYLHKYLLKKQIVWKGTDETYRDDLNAKRLKLKVDRFSSSLLSFLV